MDWIDTHAHLTSEALLSDLDGILDRAKAARVKTVVNITTDHDSLRHALAIKESPITLYHTAAVTPHDVATLDDEFFPEVCKAALDKQLIAIGETGLDYFYEHSPKDIQIECFKRHLLLAKECNLPVVIHCREAFSDLLEILDQIFSSPKVLIHCFTGTLAEASACLERGYMISMSGIATFKKSTALQEVFKMIPLESLFIETDSPYLAPPPYRGKTNEPAYVVEIGKYLAHLKQIPIEDLMTILHNNFLRFFHHH